jgi:PKD repeat protein
MLNFLVTDLLKLAAVGLVLAALAACGGGGNAPAPVSGGTAPVVTTTVAITPTVVNITPVASFTAAPNALLVAFDGSSSLDADGSIASYAWNFGEPTSGPANTASNSTASHAFAASGTYTVTLTVTDKQGATGTKLLSVAVSPPLAVATGKLNDTGITARQCYSAGTNVLFLCSSAAALALSDTQDGMQGRDVAVATNSDADGKLGFSFTKIGASGETLPASAAAWSCVKDNVTGLMWEVKTNDGGLRDWTKTYTNYDDTSRQQVFVQHFSTSDPFLVISTGTLNPTQAQIDAATNSEGFKNAVNAISLCGATDWRLPTVEELEGIVDYGADGPKIDASWFPNTGRGSFRSSSDYVGDPIITSFFPLTFLIGQSWYVNFDDGAVNSAQRGSRFYLRLVRASQ